MPATPRTRSTTPGRDRRIKNRSEKFHGLVNKRGKVEFGPRKTGDDLQVGPVLLAFFVFVVVGSAIFQIIRNAQTGVM